jgi:hypothetical protein
MPISSTGHFSFFRTSSAWQVQEGYRAQRRQMVQSYLADASAAGSAFAGAWSNQIQGSAALAATAAANRIKAAAQTAANVNLSV